MKLMYGTLGVAMAMIHFSCDNAETERSGKHTENITADEMAEAGKVKAHVDPIDHEVKDFHRKIREMFRARDFTGLEKIAKELRVSRAIWGNGIWKIDSFYSCMAPANGENAAAWKLHDEICREWLKSNPASITAHSAYAEFLGAYAWEARGSGYADTVTDKGYELFGERLAGALEIFAKARELPEKDPGLYSAAMRVALGQGWEKADFDRLLDEAHAVEPTYWQFEATRAYSLLPRWYGEPGDWEAFALNAAARKDGLGNEIYARIVMKQMRFYDNVFQETKVEWGRVKDGLKLLRGKYPQSLEILHRAAFLSAQAEDQEFCKLLIDEIGGRYYQPVWRKPARFVHVRNWTESGKW
ncbi:MAG: hypothetical protein V4733_06845 [Verrucomicrobiota bacterium]